MSDLASQYLQLHSSCLELQRAWYEQDRLDEPRPHLFNYMHPTGDRFVWRELMLVCTDELQAWAHLDSDVSIDVNDPSWHQVLTGLHVQISSAAAELAHRLASQPAQPLPEEAPADGAPLKRLARTLLHELDDQRRSNLA